MPRSKEELLAQFRELIELTSLDEGGPQSFRVRAYETAADSIKVYRGELSELDKRALVALEGIGASTAKKIREYYETGTIAKLEALRREYPADFVALSRIPGLGPKTLALLRSGLGIENLEQLRGALRDRKVRELKGMGAVSEEKLSRAVERLELKKERRPLADVLPIAERLAADLRSRPEVLDVVCCGSVRRFRDDVADVDLVIAASSPAALMEHFVGGPLVREILGHGERKSSVRLEGGLQVDLRVLDPSQMGAGMLYFTGSKAHNIKLRQRALARGWTLNEYGLTELESGELIAAHSEEDIYRALEMQWVPPPMREDQGEIEAAAEGRLPPTMAAGLLRGDVHVHSDLSGDARSPLEEMVAAAAARGYEYLAITDHGEDLRINGVSRGEIRTQRERIAELQREHPNMRLLSGCELNIGKGGELDYDPEFRSELDFCLAGVHSHFDEDRKTQTARILRAIRDPSVDAIAHLSGRRIGRRPGIDLDIEAVLAAAAETRTAIEVNSGLTRLDAEADVIRRGVELGVIFVITSDAHHVSDLGRCRYGAELAVRGWLPPELVANAWPLDRFLTWLRERRLRHS